MAEVRNPTRWAGILGADMAGRVIFVLGVAFALSACAAAPARTSANVGTARTGLSTAVSDAEAVARRAQALNSAERKQLAAIQMDEVEVILRKARSLRDRIRREHQAAVSDLSWVRVRVQAERDIVWGEYDPTMFPQEDFEEKPAVDRVDRIAANLAAADRDVAKIEQIVASLRDLGSPGRI